MNKETFLQVDYRLLLLEEIEYGGEKHKLTAQVKLIYSYLKSLSNSFDVVRPSLQGIADTLGLGSEQVVRRDIKKLSEAGLVSIIARPGSSNAYQVHPLPGQESDIKEEHPIVKTEQEQPAKARTIIKSNPIVPLTLTPAQQDKIDQETKRLSRPAVNEKPIQMHKRSYEAEEIPFY